MMVSREGTHPSVITRRRGKITALPLYHSGHLQVQHMGAKAFTGYFGELRGSTIFLYTDEQNDTYSQSLELQGLRGVELDQSCSRRGLCIYILTLPNQTVCLQVDGLDAGEEWSCFILTVAMLQIPSQLQLLPGQRLRLEEVLDQERRRTSHPIMPALSDDAPRPRLHTSPSNPELPMPPCFYPVSRQEAEHMLIDSPEYGDIILRPSTESNSYALTVKHTGSSGGPVLRHYKVRAGGSAGFIVDLKTPVTSPSLTDIVHHFLSRARQSLRPYLRTYKPTTLTCTYGQGYGERVELTQQCTNDN